MSGRAEVLAAVLADLNVSDWRLVSAHGCDGTEEVCAQTCPVPMQEQVSPEEIAAALDAALAQEGDLLRRQAEEYLAYDDEMSVEDAIGAYMQIRFGGDTGREEDWQEAGRVARTSSHRAAQEGDQGEAAWPEHCTCGHDAHLHDAEADPVLCTVCGDNTRCNYASPEEIAADRWEEGHSQGVIDYMRRYDSGLTPGERMLRAVEMVDPWAYNPYRTGAQP